MKQRRKVVSLVSALIVLLAFAFPPIVNAQSYDYYYQEIIGEAYISSPREARCRYSVTIKNAQVRSLGTWTLGLYARPDSIYSVDRVLDETGSLNYEFLKGDPGSSPQIKITFRKAISPGEIYRFSYEYTAKWNYNSYGWQVGWSTPRIIEKIKLEISVSDQMKIIRTYPAGAYSDDRKSAETEATNVKTSYLSALYPPTSARGRAAGRP